MKQTATTLTSAVYLLALHPEFILRLRKEILSQVGPTRRPTSEDIKHMKLLRAVINGQSASHPLSQGSLNVAYHDRNPSFVSRCVSEYCFGSKQRLISSTYQPLQRSVRHASPSQTTRMLNSVIRVCNKSTTLPSHNPNEKPFYIAAGTE